MVKERLVLQVARLIGEATRLTRHGGGTALPGLVIERAAPELVAQLAARLREGTIIVSGTNGKTTTTRILSGALESSDHRVVHNRSGSNLMRGIAAALAQDSDGSGRETIGLFEVDEATLPLAIPALQPRAVVLLNLFRDQLDRYGEVDTIARLWRGALQDLPHECTVALNADDPLVASLGKGLSGRVLYYGLDDSSHGLTQRERAADFVECLVCGVPYTYTLTLYGHLGHYVCPTCGWGRPRPDIRATEVRLNGLEGATLTLETDPERLPIDSPLPGLYNQYNLLAAAAGLIALGRPLTTLAQALKGFEPAFGRAERFRIDGKDVIMLLTKNPVGTNQVMRLVGSIPGQKPMLLALNDRAADGEDVSWIWDADYEALRGQVQWTVIAGRRAEDLALRLKYAGVVNETVPPIVLKDPEQALRTALYRLAPGETLYVLPTYTAMLELRQVLNHMGVARPFWE